MMMLRLVYALILGFVALNCLQVFEESNAQRIPRDEGTLPRFVLLWILLFKIGWFGCSCMQLLEPQKNSFETCFS